MWIEGEEESEVDSEEKTQKKKKKSTKIHNISEKKNLVVWEGCVQCVQGSILADTNSHFTRDHNEPHTHTRLLKENRRIPEKKGGVFF